MKQNKYVLWVLILPFTLFFAHGTHAMSGGLSPSQINNTILLPGSTFSQEFSVNRSDVAQATDVQLTIDEELEDIVSIEEGLKLHIPAQHTKAIFHVVVHIPEQSKPQTYDGMISIAMHSAEGEENASASTDEQNDDVGSSTDIQIQLQLPIHFVVQEEEIEQMSVSDIIVQPIQQGASLPIFYMVDNTGNMPAQPTQADVTITNAENKEEVMHKQVEIPAYAVPAFSRQLRVIQLSDELVKGSYVCQIKLYNAQDVFVGERTTSFEVTDEQPIPFDIALQETAITSTDNQHQPIIAALTVQNKTKQFVPLDVEYQIYTTKNKQVDTIHRWYGVQPETEQAITDTFEISQQGTVTIQPIIHYPNGSIQAEEAIVVLQEAGTSPDDATTNETDISSVSMQRQAALLVLIALVLAGGIVWYKRTLQFSPKVSKSKPESKKKTKGSAKSEPKKEE